MLRMTIDDANDIRRCTPLRQSPSSATRSSHHGRDDERPPALRRATCPIRGPCSPNIGPTPREMRLIGRLRSYKASHRHGQREPLLRHVRRCDAPAVTMSELRYSSTTSANDLSMTPLPSRSATNLAGAADRTVQRNVQPPGLGITIGLDFEASRTEIAVFVQRPRCRAREAGARRSQLRLQRDHLMMGRPSTAILR